MKVNVRSDLVCSFYFATGYMRDARTRVTVMRHIYTITASPMGTWTPPGATAPRAFVARSKPSKILRAVLYELPKHHRTMELHIICEKDLQSLSSTLSQNPAHALHPPPQTAYDSQLQVMRCFQHAAAVCG